MRVVFRLERLANLNVALAGGHASAQLPEEAFEPGGRDQAEELAVWSELEPVAGVARYEDQGARLGGDRVMPDVELDRSLEDVEELVAVDVNVGRRPVAFGSGQLDDLEGVAGLLGGDPKEGPPGDQHLALTGRDRIRAGFGVCAH